MTRRMTLSNTVYTADLENWRDAVTKKQFGTMSGPRILVSASALFIGAISIYTALHYLPSLMKPQAVLADIPMTVQEADAIEESRYGPVIGPYIEQFKVKRTYLKPGQTIQAQYVLPKGATLDLSIKQCSRLWIIEVYHCKVVSSEMVRIEDSTFGQRNLTFSEGGFYHFDQQVTLPATDADYRIIWSRH